MCHFSTWLSCHIPEFISDNKIKISYNKVQHERHLENNNYLIFKTIAYSTGIETSPSACHSLWTSLVTWLYTLPHSQCTHFKPYYKGIIFLQTVTSTVKSTCCQNPTYINILTCWSKSAQKTGSGRYRNRTRNVALVSLIRVLSYLSSA